MAEEKYVKLKNVGNRFLKLKCKDCGNEQITYSKISTEVVCSICGALIAKPTGGTLRTSAEILEVL